MPLFPRTNLTRKGYSRLEPLPVGTRMESDHRWTRMSHPKLKPSRMPPEACRRRDAYRTRITRTVEEPLADQENRFSLSILDRASTSR